MSILNVNQIQPVGGGNTITVSASDISASGATITASSFVGPLTGNLTGNVTSSSTSTFSSGINVTGGRVLVGTTDAGSNGTADDLVVANNNSASDQAGISIRGGTSGRSQIFFSDGTSGQDEYRGMLRYEHSDNSMQFRTDAAERLRITSAGKVGVNETAPAADLVVKQSGNTFTTQSQTVALFQRSSTSGHGAKIAIVAGTGGSSEINFGDTADEDIGIIQYFHTDNSLRFTTNTAERLRITSAGNIGINNQTPLYPLHFKNAMASAPSFIHMEVTGTNTVGGGGGIQFDTSASNAQSNNGLYLAQISGERSSSDNGSNTLVFKTTKAGTFGDDGNTHSPKTRMTIDENGDVNISDGNLVVASGHGIDFAATSDASGMSSELLDDYEEGTWEPTFTSTAGAFNSVTYNSDTGARYTKVGSLVTVTGCARCTAIDTSNIASGQTLCIGGLPFTNVARSNGDNADNIGSCRVPVWGNTNNCPHAIQARQNQTFCTLLNYEIDNVTNTNIVSQANNSMMVQFSLQYSAA